MEWLQVGALVTLPAEPDWGVGQVQSIVTDAHGARVTVNFQGAGKQVLNAHLVELELVSPEQG
ncbi:MAG: DUF3553 domain-containing protein [Rhodobacteraceae bacterium]|nr:DUF3553 domain-containing protein [Paracoccaceae bacterium]